MIGDITPGLFVHLFVLFIPLLVAFGPVIILLFYRLISEEVWQHIGLSMGMTAPLFLTTLYLVAADIQNHISVYTAPVTLLLPLSVVPFVAGIHCYNIRHLENREIGFTAFAYLAPVVLFPLFLLSLGIIGL